MRRGSRSCGSKMFDTGCRPTRTKSVGPTSTTRYSNTACAHLRNSTRTCESAACQHGRRASADGALPVLSGLRETLPIRGAALRPEVEHLDALLRPLTSAPPED